MSPADIGAFPPRPVKCRLRDDAEILALRAHPVLFIRLLLVRKSVVSSFSVERACFCFWGTCNSPAVMVK
jgi:hypothetical protein